MALIQWKQIDPQLRGDGYLTGSLDITGSLMLNGIDVGASGIFKQTGSVWTTTNDLEITGSLRLELDGVSDYFSVDINGESQVKVNEQGVFQLASKDSTPSAVAGGMFFSSSNEYFLGFI